MIRQGVPMSRIRTRNHREKRCGAAAVELAIVAPFICFMLIVAIDYGRVFYYSLTLKNGARSGAYYASDYPGIYSFANAQQATAVDFQNMSPPPTIDVKYSSSPNGPYTSVTPISNGYVQVTASWDFHTITSYPGIPTTTTLQRSCRMKVAPIVPTF